MARFSLANLRSFWRRTSDGLDARQLWDQFRRETRSSLDLYSAETGRNLREEWSARKGRLRVIAAVAGAMYKRLTPVRRLLLLLAVFLLVFPAFDSTVGGRGLSVHFNSTPAALILLALLVLELADRVGLKRDGIDPRHKKRLATSGDKTFKEFADEQYPDLCKGLNPEEEKAWRRAI